MKRSKRRLQQLEQMVRMKADVLQQQKHDAIDIINDYTSSVLSNIEVKKDKFEEKSQEEYEAMLLSLDEASDVLARLTSYIDSTLSGISNSCDKSLDESMGNLSVGKQRTVREFNQPTSCQVDQSEKPQVIEPVPSVSSKTSMTNTSDVYPTSHKRRSASSPTVSSSSEKPQVIEPVPSVSSKTSMTNTSDAYPPDHKKRSASSPTVSTSLDTWLSLQLDQASCLTRLNFIPHDEALASQPAPSPTQHRLSHAEQNMHSAAVSQPTPPPTQHRLSHSEQKMHSAAVSQPSSPTQHRLSHAEQNMHSPAVSQPPPPPIQHRQMHSPVVSQPTLLPTQHSLSHAEQNMHSPAVSQPTLPPTQHSLSHAEQNMHSPAVSQLSPPPTQHRLSHAEQNMHSAAVSQPSPPPTQHRLSHAEQNMHSPAVSQPTLPPTKHSLSHAEQNMHSAVVSQPSPPPAQHRQSHAEQNMYSAAVSQPSPPAVQHRQSHAEQNMHSPAVSQPALPPTQYMQSHAEQNMHSPAVSQPTLPPTLHRQSHAQQSMHSPLVSHPPPLTQHRLLHNGQNIQTPLVNPLVLPPTHMAGIMDHARMFTGQTLWPQQSVPESPSNQSFATRHYLTHPANLSNVLIDQRHYPHAPHMWNPGVNVPQLPPLTSCFNAAPSYLNQSQQGVLPRLTYFTGSDLHMSPRSNVVITDLQMSPRSDVVIEQIPSPVSSVIGDFCSSPTYQKPYESQENALSTYQYSPSLMQASPIKSSTSSSLINHSSTEISDTVMNIENIAVPSRQNKAETGETLQTSVSKTLEELESLSYSSSSSSGHKCRSSKRKSSHNTRSISPDLMSVIQKTLHEIKGQAEETHQELQSQQNLHKIKLQSEGISQAVSPIAISPVRLKNDEINVVVVTHVEDPWSIYVQMTSILPTITAQIEETVDSGSRCPISVKPGGYCLAKFTDGRYYRAEIMKYQEGTNHQSKIQVFYIDYGNKHWITSADLLQMPKSLSKHPAQAVLCAVAKIKPNIADAWVEKATDLVRQLTRDKTAQMRVVRAARSRSRNVSGNNRPAEGNSSLGRHLVDIVLRQGVSDKVTTLSKALIKSGYASPVDIDEQIECLTSQSNQPTLVTSLPGLQKLLQEIKSGGDGDNSSSADCAKQKTNSWIGPNPSSAYPVSLSNGTGASGLNPCSKKFIPACLLRKNLKLSSQGLKLKKDREEGTQSRISDRDKANDVFTSTVNRTSVDRALSRLVDKKLFDLGQSVVKKGKSDSDDMEECPADVEYQVVVVSVISPSSFFVHRVTEDLARTLAVVTVRLNEEFRSLPQQTLQTVSSKFVPDKHSLCCGLFSKDDCFYRAVVLEISSQRQEHSSLLLFFIDFGDFEWVPRQHVYPLPEVFRTIPPVAQWCRLEGVKPHFDETQHTSSYNMDWSDEAVDKFMSMVEGSKVFSIVTSKTAQSKVEGSSSHQSSPVPVYLIEQPGVNEGFTENWVNGVHGQPEEICINFDLVDLGLAKVEPSTTHHLDEQSAACDEIPDNWNPMMEEYESARNSYNINIEDPGVALVGYESGNVGRDGRKVCIFYNRPNGCYKGDNCPNLHIKIAKDGLSHDQMCVHVFDEDQTSLLPNKGQVIMVTVATVSSPSEFYVTLPWGRLNMTQINTDCEAKDRFLSHERLEGLVDNLQTFYAHCPYKGDFSVLAKSQAVAAKVKDTWIRAKVIDVDTEEFRVKVISVDFGWSAWVKETNIRDLELRFLHLPPQAVECGLSDITSSSDTGEWSHDACSVFAELVTGKTLVAYVKHRYSSGRLRVVLYDTVSGSKDVDINHGLLNVGFAKAADDHIDAQHMSENSDGINVMPA